MRPWRGWSGARLQRVFALALLPASLGALVLHCAVSPEVPFLRADPAAPWWMAPTQVSAILEQWGAEGMAVTRFARDLELAPRPQRAAISVRALRDFTLRVNGEVADAGRGGGPDWRVPRRVDVSGLLRDGANRIEIDVTNRRGPALVSVRGDGFDAGGAPDWQTSLDGVALGAAIPADDTRPNPNAFAVETPAEALVASRDALISLFVAGAAALALASGRVSSRRLASLPSAALLAAALAWVWLFVAKVVDLPLRVGFDARAHVEYVDFLREHGALPLATDGWSMYHPPLFYVLTALLRGISEHAMKVVPWIAGLGLVFVAHSLATRLYRGEPRIALLSVVFAAVLPVDLYSAAYFSNETLHALLAGLALVATVDALVSPRSTLRQALAIGLWLGLAALAKFTVLAVVPVALFFLTAKLWLVERMPPARALGRAVACAAAFAALSGWFYARNQLHFGTPVLGNWALPGADQAWWQQPGFHTLAYYTGFGESLRHPYFAGFTSFWDGIYSTFWGDGYIAGRVYPHERHALWDYDFMSAGYLLALPLTALLGLGIERTLMEALRDPDPARRAALSFLLTASYAVAFACLSLTLSLPFFAQAKAPYVLCLVPVASVCFARGATAVDAWLARPGRHALRIGFAGLLAACLGCLFLAFAA